MMTDESDDLLRRAIENDPLAADQLFAIHRERLKKMVAVRMDQRLRKRLDPSDVVQEALFEASRRLPEYLAGESIPFYPWLRQMAINRLIDLHRRNITAQRRNVDREAMSRLLPDESVMELADRLAAPVPSPSRIAERREQRQRVSEKLLELKPELREVLVLLYLEELPSSEVAAILGVNERTIRRRHRQAIEQLESLYNH